MNSTSYAASHAETQSWLAGFDRTLTGKAVLAVAASLFVALCAHVSVPLPFTPVPLTLGNMAVVLVGLALGPATAFAALVLYLAEGACGLPVFNPGGPGGLAQMLGPTGGYLFAYPFAAALASFVMRRSARVRSRFLTATLGAAAGTALVLACGVSWLAFELHLTLPHALLAGLVPFLPGEIVKVFSAAGLGRLVYRTRS